MNEPLESQFGTPEFSDFLSDLSKEERLILVRANSQIGESIAANEDLRYSVQQVLGLLQRSYTDSLRKQPDFESDPLREKRIEDWFRAVAYGIDLAASQLIDGPTIRALNSRLQDQGADSQ